MAWWLPKKQRAEEKPPMPTRGLTAATQAIRTGGGETSNQGAWFHFSVTTLQYLASRGYKGKRMWAQPGKNSPTESSKVLGRGRQMALQAGLHPEGCLEPLTGQSAPLPLSGHHLSHPEFPKTLFPKAL